MTTPADLDFLKVMKAKANRLAKMLDSPDNWAKPFYSDVHTFKPGVPRVFIGLNPAGNRYSHQLDECDKVEEKTWSGKEPYHNSYLDERWGKGNSSATVAGQADLQKVVKHVFKAMYRDSWETELRNTPCFNLIPVSSRGTCDPKLDTIWDDGVKWGVELLEYLRPEFIILYGNAKTGKSVWATLYEKYGLNQISRPLRIAGNRFLKQDSISDEVLSGVRVVSMPHLSYMTDHLPVLEEKLRTLRPFS